MYYTLEAAVPGVRTHSPVHSVYVLLAGRVVETVRRVAWIQLDARSLAPRSLHLKGRPCA